MNRPCKGNAEALSNQQQKNVFVANGCYGYEEQDIQKRLQLRANECQPLLEELIFVALCLDNATQEQPQASRLAHITLTQAQNLFRQFIQNTRHFNEQYRLNSLISACFQQTSQESLQERENKRRSLFVSDTWTIFTTTDEQRVARH